MSLREAARQARVPRLVEILDRYAAEAFLIVDNEGEMARFVDKTVTDGKLERENVLLADDSLEQDNFSLDELIGVVREIAGNPPEGREPASLQLTPDQLMAEHADRRSRVQQNPPGLAGTMLSMAARPEHGSVRVSKTELAEGLARLVVGELRETDTQEEVEALKQRRPVVRFVIDHLCPALSRPRPIS